MRKRLTYFNSVLFTGVILTGIGIGCSGGTAHSEMAQQAKPPDAHAAGTKQLWGSTEVFEAIEHYGNVVKNTGKHDHNHLYGILSSALTDDDMEIRAAVVSALGVLGDKAVIPELLPVLRDEEMWVRLAAATALGDIDDKNVIPELVRLLEHEDARVRESAALALGAMDYKGEIPGLEDAVRRKEIDPRIAAYLLDDMNNLSEKDRLDYERRLKDKSDVYTRIVAVLAFGKIGKINKQAVVKLRESLKDGEPMVRALAVIVLGRLEDKESLAAIEASGDDEDTVVRGVAALSMGKLGDKKTLPALEKLTRDKENSVRASAALAIGRLGDRAGIPALEELLFRDGEDNIAVKLMCVAALWKLTK